MTKRFLEAGKIVSLHGVHGELRIYPWSDSPAVLSKAKQLFLDASGQKRLDIACMRVHKNLVILKLNGIDTPELARKLIDKTLYIDRGDIQLAPGSHFVQDLIGLAVKDADSLELYGVLTDVTNNGAHDVYHVKMVDGGVRLVPAVKQFVTDIDIEQKTVFIRPIEGLMRDAD